MKDLELTLNQSSTVYPADDKITLKGLIKVLKSEPILHSKSLEVSESILYFTFNSQKTLAYLSTSNGTIIEVAMPELLENTSILLFNSRAQNLAVSPSDKFLACHSDKSSVAVYNLHCRKTLGYLDMSFMSIETLSITPDERFVCIAGSDTNIHLWEFLKGTTTVTVPGHMNGINSFRIKNNVLVTGSKDATLKIWDLLSLKEISTLNYSSWVNCLEISNSGQVVASGHGDSVIKIWSLEDYIESQSLEGHKSEVYCIAFSLNDRFLASGSQDKTARLWNLKTGALEHIQDQHLNYITFIAISGNLMISSSANTVHIDNYQEKRKEIVFQAHSVWITRMALYDESKLVTSSSDKAIRLWDLNANEANFTLSGHKNFVECLNVTNDGKYVISSGWDCLIKIWSFEEKTLIHTLSGHGHYVSRLLTTSDSAKVVSTSWDGTIKVWLISTGTLEHSFPDLGVYIFRLKISYDDRFIFTSSGDFCMRMWDLNNYTELLNVPIGSPITGIELSQNNKYAFAACMNKALVVINIDRLEVEQKFQFNDQLIGLGISNDSSMLFLCLDNETVEVWSADSLTKVSVLKKHRGVWPLTILSIGKKYVSLVSNESELKIWNFLKGNEVYSLKLNSNIKCLTKTSCGRFVILGDSDGVIYIVNIKEKRVEVRKKNHSDQITSVCLNLKDKFIITCSKDLNINILKVHKHIRSGSSCLYIKKNLAKNFKNILDETNRSAPTDYFSGLTKHKSLYPALFFNGFRMRLYKKIKPEKTDCEITLFGFNILHIYSYLGQYKNLEIALQYRCQIRRDLTGRSPLFYAISKQTEKCVESILSYLINVNQAQDPNNHSESFYAIRGDFLSIIKLSSSLVPQVLNSMFAVSSDSDLPLSIKTFAPPLLILSNQRKIDISKFNKIRPNKNIKYPESFVVFRTLPFSLNITAGSFEFFKFLNSLVVSKNMKIFKTNLIKTIIDYKYKNYKIIEFVFAFMLFLNLLFLVLSIISESNNSYKIAFLIINVFHSTHEMLQIKYEGFINYIRDAKNIIEIISIFLSVSWVIASNFASELYTLIWIMVCFNFLKGISIFKAFDSTRFYLGLLEQSIKETFPFITIFLYSTVGLGVLYLASIRDDDSLFVDLWKTSYELNFGIFNNKNEFSLEYLYFLFGSYLNIIIILNLLIAILGDSFDQFQMIAEEWDYIGKLHSIFEVECVVSLLRLKKAKGFLQVCELERNEDEAGSVWEGKIKEIELTVNRLSLRLDKRLSVIESKIDSLIGRK